MARSQQQIIRRRRHLRVATRTARPAAAARCTCISIASGISDLTATRLKRLAFKTVAPLAECAITATACTG